MPDNTSRSILRGRLVTVSGPVIDHGRLLIDGARIAAVLRPEDDLPDSWRDVPPVDSGGTLYPGLIDLHGHLPYNILPLWQVPRHYDNRNQWKAESSYGARVSKPMGALFAGGSANPLLASLVRYIEVKLLLSGVCTAQGLRFRLAMPFALARGLVRNAEISDDAQHMPRAEASIGDLEVQGGNPTLVDSLQRGRLFVHLAEGVDSQARQQFDLAERDGLLQPRLVCIHCLGLDDDQRQRLHQKGATPVWSPLSNLLLYGQTWTPQPAHGPYCLGSDWSPSGSKNLLQELKVAWLWLSRNGQPPDDAAMQALLEAVTLAPARALGWDTQLGSLEPGKRADLLLLDSHLDEARANLVFARESQVRGVMVNGIWRHGDADWLPRVLSPSAHTESLTVGGRAKLLHLHDEASALNGLSFDDARTRLRKAMSQLRATQRGLESLAATGAAAAEPAIDLDMQADIHQLEAADDATRGPAMEMPESIPLDEATVVDDPGLFEALASQPNLPDGLVAKLQAIYQMAA